VIVPVMRGQTVVGSDRLQAVRPLRRRSWRWEEIAAIDVRVMRGRSVSRWVKVTTTGGRSFTLPAPTTSPWRGTRISTSMWRRSEIGGIRQRAGVVNDLVKIVRHRSGTTEVR
jgi:hypothetical protein